MPVSRARPEQGPSAAEYHAPGMQSGQVELIAAIGQLTQSVEAMHQEYARARSDMKGVVGAAAMYSTNASTAAALRTQGQAAVAAAAEQQRPPSASASVNQALAPMDSEERAPLYAGPKSWGQGRQQGFSAIRQGMAHHLSRELSDLTFGGVMMEPESGYAFDDRLNRYVSTNRQITGVNPGTIVSASVAQAAMENPENYRDPRDNSIVSASVAAASARRLGAANVVRSTVASMAGGSSLSAGVQAAMPRLAMGAGVAGAAIGGAMQAVEFVRGQRSANQPFQAVLGGSNAEGFGERWNMALNRWNPRNFFGMGGGEADAIYKGALNLYAGDREMRQAAQSNATDLFYDLGMKGQESMDVFRAASAVGADSLDQIAQSLRGVTESAREAGMNAQEARAEFTRALTEVGTLYRGGQAGVIAQVQTSALTEMGRPWEGATANNSMMFQRRLAAASGMTLSEYQGMVATGPEGVRRNIANSAAMANQAAQIATTPQAQGLVAQWMRDQGLSSGDPITNQHRQSLMAMLQSNNAILDAEGVQRILADVGGIEATSPAQAQQIVSDILLGTYDPVGEYDDQAAQWMTSRADTSRSGMDAMLKELGLADSNVSMRRQMGGGREIGRGRNRAGSIYANQVAESGQRNPVLEALLTNYDNSRRYRVDTANGPVIVGNHELLRDFADQAATGNVEIVGGENAGMTIAEAYQIPSAALSQEMAQSATERYEGKTFEDSGEGGSSGTVVIQAGPELRRFIDMQTTGNVSIEQRYAGIPQTGLNQPAYRATGG